ncbi:hypothetical protein B0O99DRAFT_692298 [Bisporella sp. PMI_857]|nr:hypothetical protein B0O99DRAFT_692298 [Bisporella sp. PMI_857]
MESQVQHLYFQPSQEYSHNHDVGVKTGINAQTGYRPPRRDILDLQKDLPQFSLYIQAMNRMMQTPEVALTSYFQIAGIHGRPFIAWDNVNPTTPDSGIPIGYCTHGNTLFPTWHRPYLALIEAIMAGHAQTIAKTYPVASRPLYQTAADNLRIPYWDWAAFPQRFPDVMTWPTVRINTPTGLVNVTNPLFQYKFLSNPEPEEWFPSTGGDSFVGSLPTTVRYPDANNKSQSQFINMNFADDGIYLTQAVWNTFAKTRTYNEMSTTANPTFANSFEGPHNTIHIFVGGNGHMSPVSYSGFDPAFWLHHTNVDRHVAMWQAIYPDTWIEPAISQGGTWTIYPNTVVDGNTPLTPFTTGDKTTPWTSNSARYTKSFGYSYPEVQDWLQRTPAQLAANVTARVNQIYNPDGSLGTFPARSMRIRDPSIAARDTKREWSVTVSVPNKAVGEGFSVKVSVGDVGVGKLFVVSAPTQIALDAGANPITNSQFTLTRGLTDVDSENVDEVLSQLRENLKWTVVKTSDGSVVPNHEVEGLAITVQDQIVTPAPDATKFPVYGEKTLHPEVTL